MRISVPVRDRIANLPLACAWAGCQETCGHGPSLPEGWIWIATWYANAQPGILDFTTDKVVRDAVLCPQHAADLESRLKPI